MDGRVNKKLYKIRNTKNGLFSQGGEHPKFTKNGKIWKHREHLLKHLKLVKNLNKIYHDCEVVVFEMIESETKVIVENKNYWLR